MNEKRLARLSDAFIAIRDYGWELSDGGVGGRKILIPPITDERRFWTAMWDEDGLPHWLPKFSAGEM